MLKENKQSLPQLYNRLKKAPLPPCILLSSDTLLLTQEAIDAIRLAAKQQGFTQRQTFNLDTSFNWQALHSVMRNGNLFGDKTLIELHNPKSKFDNQVLEILNQHIQQPNDNALLITMPKLTGAQQKTKWYQSFLQNAICVTIYPIARHELPHWLTQRCHQAGLNIAPEGIALLAEMSEGNLLAAKQTIEKLRLQYNDSNITPNKVAQVACDNARFNLFDLSNYILAGNCSQALRCLNGLRDTGTDAILVLWLLARELRELLYLAWQLMQGSSYQQILNKQWVSRRSLLKTALQRLDYVKLLTLNHQLKTIDHIIKGLQPGNAWQNLQTLIIAMR